MLNSRPPRPQYRRPQAVPQAAAMPVRSTVHGPALWILAALWLTVVFDPQWLLAEYGVRAFLGLPVILFPAVALTLGFGVLSNRSWARRWTWYAPLLAFLIVAVISSAFTINLGRSRIAVQALALHWTLIVGSVVLVDTARRAEQLVLMYGLQFLWWGLWGATSGLVFWHPALANLDGYGAWMVIGGGLCAFLALGTDSKLLKRAFYVTIALCAIGVVASFARGALLCAVAVAGVVWLRSPHKGRVFLAGIGCVLVVVIAATALHGPAYWAEMATIAQGTQEATGEDRWEMWKAAFGVFLERPLFGAGPDNWGAFAASYYQPGELGGHYGANPFWLYGRSTHNIYFQILAEEGILGTLAFLWIILDFWRRNAAMRTEAARARWKALGGKLDLRSIALGIEAAWVGWLAAAFFYSVSANHWHYTILGLNLVLHSVVTRAGHLPAAGRPRPGHRRLRPVPAAR